MKHRFLLMMALLMALAGATNTAAAQGVKFGVVGGMNLTKLKISTSGEGAQGKYFGSDNQTGWYIGGKMRAWAALGIGADVAVEYSKRTLDINGENRNYHTLEIPVNLRYQIGLLRLLDVYVATGPQFGFAFKNMRWENTLNGGNFSKENLNTTWNIGAGVMLMNRLEIGLGYNFALKKAGRAIVPSTGESKDYELEYKTNTFQVQAAVYF